MTTLTKTNGKKAAKAALKAGADQDFKVRDLTLAEWGRKEISVAEQEMPGLMAVRAKYGPQRPFDGGQPARENEGECAGEPCQAPHARTPPRFAAGVVRVSHASCARRKRKNSTPSRRRRFIISQLISISRTISQIFDGRK